ncbi:MAG TPA: hypothetical protein VFW50_45325 [Streptosporangiaceae bacterium]|nr:hypothetical protein [Streptosporangiaceae bacterium]
MTIVAGSVQLSRDGKVIRVHPIRHDRSRELGAFANSKGRPPPQELRRDCRLAAGTHLSPGYPNLTVSVRSASGSDTPAGRAGWPARPGSDVAGEG